MCVSGARKTGFWNLGCSGAVVQGIGGVGLKPCVGKDDKEMKSLGFLGDLQRFRIPVQVDAHSIA